MFTQHTAIVEQVLDGLLEIFEIERLDDKSIGFKLDAADLVFHRSFGGKEDNGDMRSPEILLEDFHEMQAIVAGEDDVRYEEVRHQVVGHRDTLHSISGLRHFILATEAFAEEAA